MTREELIAEVSEFISDCEVVEVQEINTILQIISEADYALVPVEPTFEMIRARYKAMLKAAEASE